MTTDQEAENVAASVRHLMTQRGKDAENWQRQSKDWEAQCAAQRKEIDALSRQLAELTHLVGTETPIAAFDLATTWRTEKAGYMEQVEELRRERRALCDILSADLRTVAGQTLAEAAQALSRELATLRTALCEIRDYAPMDDYGGEHAREIARRAVGGAE